MHFIYVSFLFWFSSFAQLVHVDSYCDNNFFSFLSTLWGSVKDHVYAQNPSDIKHMRSLIEEEIVSLNSNIELCEEICRSILDRCQMYIDSQAKQFEHLR